MADDSEDYVRLCRARGVIRVLPCHAALSADFLGHFIAPRGRNMPIGRDQDPIFFLFLLCGNFYGQVNFGFPAG